MVSRGVPPWCPDDVSWCPMVSRRNIVITRCRQLDGAPPASSSSHPSQVPAVGSSPSPRPPYHPK
eukprot:2912960-Pyramimonas_sp.AAC.1